MYSYPCNSTPDVGFTFKGSDNQVLSINPMDFSLGEASSGNGQCVGGIIGMNFKNRHTGGTMGIVGGWYPLALSYPHADGYIFIFIYRRLVPEIMVFHFRLQYTCGFRLGRFK